MPPPPRLNLFQRLVRQWDMIHPYNAAQAIKLQGRPEVPALRAAWCDAIKAIGLRPSPPDVVRHVEQADATLESLLSNELNRRFDDGHDAFPFRPFVLDDGPDHYLGVVYHHWVADGVSIRAVLREWFLRRYDPARARREPMKLADAGYFSLFGPGAGGWSLRDGLLHAVRCTRDFRRVRRMSARDAERMEQAVTIRRLDDGVIDAARAACRSAGATVHDLILAAAAEACDRHLPMHRHRGRDALAMGTIVDLRPAAAVDLSDTFGMFLGCTTTVCHADELADWPRLAATVAAQGRVHKWRAHAQANAVRMAAGLVAGASLPRQRLIEFYRKRAPLAGGTSNVNLNTTWAAEHFPNPLLEYVRVSPTGPAMPLVFSTTTLGRQFNLCLTRRRDVVSETTADAITDSVFTRLRQTARRDDVSASVQAPHDVSTVAVPV